MKTLLKTDLRRFALVTAAALIGFTQAKGQVSVAPTTVVIENRSPFGEFLVANRSNTAQEIAIDFQFGFPVSDEKGETYMEYEDIEKGAPYDLGDRVRAFPRRFLLPPGEQQTVRLIVRPGEDTRDGAYWTRIVTTSNPREEDVEAQELEDDVSARILFRVRQVTTLLFKNGSVNTGVHVRALTAREMDDEVFIDVEVERDGNAPFIGRSALKIFNEDDQLVFEREQNLSLYFENLRRYTAPLDDFPPGAYRAELTFRAERRDIPRNELIAMEDARHETTFTLPAEQEKQTDHSHRTDDAETDSCRTPFEEQSNP